MVNYRYEREPLLYVRERIFPERHLPELVATLAACLASLSIGFALGFSSPTIPELEQKGSLSGPGDASWFGSSLPLGAAAGAQFAILLIDKLGRKGSVMLCNLPIAAGYLLLVCAEDDILLFVARGLTGFGIGIATAAVPIYIAEIATKENRGRLSTISQAFMSSGVLLVYALGAGVGFMWLSVVGILITLITVCAMYVMPETPRFYLTIRYKAGAFKTLYWLRGRDANIMKEANEIHTNITKNAEIRYWTELAKKKNIFSICIVICMQILFNLVGKSIVDFYAQSILQSVGFAFNAHLPTVSVGLAGVVGVIPAALVMDKWHRKTLLYLSGIIMCIANFTLGFYFFLIEVHHKDGLQWLSLPSLLFYNIGYSLGPGTTGWLIVAEVLPIKVRALGLGIASTTNWLMAFLVTKQFPILVEATANYVAIWCLSGSAVLLVVFTCLSIPETKGRSLEEIERTTDSRFADD